MKKLVLFFIFTLTCLVSSNSENAFTQEELLNVLKPHLEKAATYKKFKIIYARNAVNGEEISTYTADGLETKNTAKSGDYVVKNTTDAKEMYILTKEKFDKRYKYQKKLDNTWNVYEPLGEIKVLKVDKSLLKTLGIKDNEFYIIASWGEKMIVKTNDFLVSPLDYSEVYRIAEKEFFETYKKK